MLADHPLVSTELLGVAIRSPEDLAPPGGHVLAVQFGNPARKEGGEQLVGFEAIVEGVDEALERVATASPLVQRRGVN
jgi:hypothetical protein